VAVTRREERAREPTPETRSGQDGLGSSGGLVVVVPPGLTVPVEAGAVDGRRVELGRAERVGPG